MYKLKITNCDNEDEPYEVLLYFSNEKDAKIVRDFIDTQNSDYYEFDEDQEELEYLLEKYGKYKNYSPWGSIEQWKIEPPIPKVVRCCGAKRYTKYCGDCGTKLVK